MVLSDLPHSCKTIGCKWIFRKKKKKLRTYGTIENFEARPIYIYMKENYINNFIYIVNILLFL